MTYLVYILLFLYTCHISNMSSIKLLLPLAIIDKITRLIIAITFVIKYTIIISIIGYIKHIISFLIRMSNNKNDIDDNILIKMITDFCFEYSILTFGFIFPKLIGFRTVYTKHVDITKPMVYICNHHNITDGFVIYVAGIKAYWIAKEGVENEVPIIGRFMKYGINNANLIFYNRGNKESGEMVKEKVIDVIKNKKQNIVVYPEGTTQKCGSPILPFKKGMFHTTYDNYIPVQPISLQYTKFIGHDKHDKSTIMDFYHIMDLTIVCVPSDIIVREDNEDFDTYFARIQKSIVPEIYHAY